MAAADVVLTWFADSPKLSVVAKSAFTRPTVFLAMPAGFVPELDAGGQPVIGADGKPKMKGRDYDGQITAYGPKALRAIIAKYAPGLEPLRVCLVGFSQGCQGVRAALRHGESARVDAVLAIDGIHAGYPKGDKTKLVAPDVTPYVAYGAAAREDGRLFVISTSSIVPGGFASTTQTANFLWRAVTGQDADIQEHDLPPGFWAHEEVPPVAIKFQCIKEQIYTQALSYRYRNVGGFVINNYVNQDPTGCADHIYQAHHVLPLIAHDFLAARWNAQPPTEGVCLTA